MSFLWPRYVRENPSPAGRLGRLAHYASALPAAYLLWVAWGYDPSDHEASWIVTFGALLVYLCGRGTRWVMAGE